MIYYISYIMILHDTLCCFTLTLKSVILAVCAYALIAMGGFAFNDIVAVWAATPVEKGFAR